MSNTIEIELSVPTSLGEITLSQYQKYMKIVEVNKDDDNATDFLNMKLIEIFCNVDLSYVKKIPFKEYEKVLRVLSKAFKKESELIRRFDLKGVDMGFVPNLEFISLGEYVDLEEYIQDWDNMHKAMAVLYRPVNFKSKQTYTIAPYEPSDDISELMKDMPLSVVMSSMVFFYNLGRELLEAIPTFITKSLNKEETYLFKQILEVNGGGINQFTHSLKEMFSNSIPLQNFNYSSA